MNLAELQAQHPGLYAQAVAVGVNQERERAAAHVTMANASGNVDFRYENVSKDGSEFGPKVNAEYMAFQMNNQQIKGMADENIPEVDASAPTPEAGPTALEARDEEVANALAEKYGIKEGIRWQIQ